jgi:hypothetical protein
MSGYSEDELIEQPAIELFGELGYEVARCFNETFGRGGTLGRENWGEVVLVGRLREVAAGRGGGAQKSEDAQTGGRADQPGAQACAPTENGPAAEDGHPGGGRLGVFWHTQGSGKSYSMVFFSQKVLRKLHGDWTSVVVTDRQELDDQIYRTFVGAGAVKKEEEQVQGAARDLLAALKKGKLVLDWRKKQTAKAQVQVTISRMLHERLPRVYSLVEMRQKTDAVYQHVYDAYWGEGRSLYASGPVDGVSYRAE